MRTGTVCILGRPNAGKSTLLNALVGEKLAIVTPKPQTTRARVLGILNVAGEAQVVLIDTPGVHKSRNALDRRMAREIREALAGCDLLLWIRDASRPIAAEDDFVLSLVRKAAAPVFLLLNKIDLIDKKRLLPMIAELQQLHGFRQIIPISARTRSGLPQLVKDILQVLPEGPPLFAEDQFTDQPVRFLTAEIIREQVLLHTGEEVPYAVTVGIERFQENGALTSIAAVIYCEREGQKGIIIGKGGQMLKRIGMAARRQIEAMLGTKVFLELYVKVEPGWRERADFIESLDWRTSRF